MVGSSFHPDAMGGGIVIENVFSIPNVGRVLWHLHIVWHPHSLQAAVEINKSAAITFYNISILIILYTVQGSVVDYCILCYDNKIINFSIIGLCSF